MAAGVKAQAKAPAKSKRATVPAVKKQSGSTGVVEALAAAPVTAQPRGAAETMRVSPHDLVLDTNVRADPRVGLAFIESLREHGVLVPILVRRDPLGQLLVIDGQRRLLGAVSAGLDEVLVTVVDGIGDDESRIVTQVTVNEHRTGLTPAEQIQAVQEMALFGRTPASIAKRLAQPKQTVEAAIALNAKPTTAAAVLEAAPSLDLVQVAAIAQFDDDPKTVERMTAEALRDPTKIPHLVQFELNARAEKVMLAARVDELEKAGVTTTTIPYYFGNSPISSAKELRYLVDVVPPVEGAKPGAELKTVPINPEMHAECPGHVVYVGVRQGTIHEEIYCTAWRKKHRDKHASTKATTADAKEERKRTVENNKLSDTAALVRHAWIRELLHRKKLPTDVLNYIANVHFLSPFDVKTYSVERVLAGIEGDVEGSRDARRSLLASGPTPERYLLLVGIALGEHSMKARDWWKQDYEGDVREAHLTYLAAAGYPLSDLESTWLEEYAAKKPRKKMAS